jgi:hypothetical protein
MSMNRILSIGFLAMTIAAGAAHAAQQAKFHLPVEARWGDATLPPGDYKVSLPELSLGVSQFVVKSNDKTRYVLPMVTDRADGSSHDPSYLRLVKVNGTYFVAEYRSTAAGKTFSFAVPKPKRQVEITDQDVLKLGVSGN